LPTTLRAEGLLADGSVGPGKALLAAGFTARQRTGGSDAGKGLVARPESGARTHEASLADHRALEKLL
jgi:hypothetical protein